MENAGLWLFLACMALVLMHIEGVSFPITFSSESAPVAITLIICVTYIFRLIIKEMN